ncbi:MAG: hypothetical protein AB7E80_15705 [Hyphomicrobiaceae bacterium]
MTEAQDDIHPLEHHPDAVDLSEYEFPAQSLRDWRGVLMAKAWVGADLACFFSHIETGERIVVMLRAGRGFLPQISGEDMRIAPVDALYELDVFVADRVPPIVDRVQRFP